MGVLWTAAMISASRWSAESAYVCAGTRFDAVRSTRFATAVSAHIWRGLVTSHAPAVGPIWT